ncbi:MAG: hypothetical protein ABI601_03765 [bacterium]
MFFVLSFLAGTALAILGYAQARSFVTRRLRYVDAVHTTLAPFIAGVGAALIALPIMAFLPYVGAGTALSFGVAVGAGVAAGSREVRRRLPGL